MGIWRSSLPRMTTSCRLVCWCVCLTSSSSSSSYKRLSTASISTGQLCTEPQDSNRRRMADFHTICVCAPTFTQFVYVPCSAAGAARGSWARRRGVCASAGGAQLQPDPTEGHAGPGQTAGECGVCADRQTSGAHQVQGAHTAGGRQQQQRTRCRAGRRHCWGAQQPPRHALMTSESRRSSVSCCHVGAVLPTTCATVCHQHSQLRLYA